MTMQISSQTPYSTPRPSAPPPEPEKTMVERLVDRTILSANYLGSSLSGAVGGLGAFGSEAVQASVGTTASALVNLWKTETIGPNLKILGTLAAAPLVAAGAAVALPVCAVAGLVHGARTVDRSAPRELTLGQAAVNGFEKTRQGFQGFSSELRQDLAELGARKLEDGEKPIDIPLIKTAKTLAMGAAAAAVGGVTGVVCALVGTARQVGAGLSRTLGDPNLNIPGKVLAGAGAVIGGTVQGLAFGTGSAVSILGKGLTETWKKDSIVQGGQAILRHAVASVRTAAAPESTLLEEGPRES